MGHERISAVLRSVRAQLGAAAAQADPRLAEQLGYLGALLAWSEDAIERLGSDSSRRERIARLAARAGRSGASDAQLAAELVRAAEQSPTESQRLLAEFLKTLGPDEPAPLRRAGHAADSPAGPDRERYTAYLRQRLGRDDVEVTEAGSIATGYSMLTTFVSYRAGAEQTDVVFRQVPDGLPIEGLMSEYEVIERVWTPTQPVPEPLWLEAGENLLGPPLFVSAHAIGETIGDFAGPRRDVPPAMCQELAGWLAALHTSDAADVEQAPIGPMRDRDEVLAAIDDLEDLAVRSAGIPDGRLAAILTWLRLNAPASGWPVALLHGDVGFHNLLIHEGHLSAVLDWERAHVGDPAEELAYIRPSLEPSGLWDDFVDAYVDAGGTRPDAHAMRFYTVWQDTWRHVECLQRAADFDRSRRFISALAGFVLGPRFLEGALAAAFPSLDSRQPIHA